MPSPELENLAEIGSLKKSEVTRREIESLLKMGRAKLRDAANDSNSIESRFDLAYNAAHAISLAALWLSGYRSENRYVVFQSLPHTAGIPNATWRILDKAHAVRNIMEYQGEVEVDPRLLKELILAVRAINEAVKIRLAGL